MREVKCVKGEFAGDVSAFSAVCPFCEHRNILADEADVCCHQESVSPNGVWTFVREYDELASNLKSMVIAGVVSEDFAEMELHGRFGLTYPDAKEVIKKWKGR